MKKEHAIHKISGKTSALDKKIIEPAEVVEVDASEDDADADDELEEEPSGEAEVVVLSDEEEANINAPELSSFDSNVGCAR
ncbi:hypothetical protein ACTXT7_017027 [Hymenolepis weldensis]